MVKANKNTKKRLLSPKASLSTYIAKRGKSITKSAHMGIEEKVKLYDIKA